MIFYKTDKLTVRRLETNDKKLIVKWLSDNKILQYYEGRDNPHSEAMVEKKFYDGNTEETRCIIEYLHIPIGYIQFYPIDEEELNDYGYKDFYDKIYGTDQFIGETEYWGQGIGKMLMKSMINYLVREKDAKKIVLDPQTWNERAIKCYESSGFNKVKLLAKHEMHEGELKDCYLMEYSAQ